VGRTWPHYCLTRWVVLDLITVWLSGWDLTSLLFNCCLITSIFNSSLWSYFLLEGFQIFFNSVDFSLFRWWICLLFISSVSITVYYTCVLFLLTKWDARTMLLLLFKCIKLSILTLSVLAYFSNNCAENILSLRMKIIQIWKYSLLCIYW